ncbi:MAG: polysaccharide deacetylase family protein, partial [Candidatus Hodarchaeales archaeon]
MTEALAINFHGIRIPQLEPYLSSHQDVDRYTIDKTLFSRIIDLITNRDVCSVSELSERKNGRWIIPTFDDGLISDYEIAAPSLLDRGLTGTLYITYNNIGRPGFCNRLQIQELADAGLEIGSHGLTHQYLISLSHEEVYKEICDSKKRLEDLIHKPVLSFAAVGGH